MRVSVIAHPNSKNPRIEKDLFGHFHVYVNQPPTNGRANAAVVQALAKYFKTAKSQISLLKGHSGKRKLFEVI